MGPWYDRPVQARINGTRLFYRDEGPRKGLPVVLIHAFPLCHAMWEPQVAALRRGFRVVSYDIRGLGRSAAGDGQSTMELLVDDLAALLDRLELPAAVLCGLSLGGYIALRFAQREPARVRGLVLADTRSQADSDEAKLSRAAAMRAIKAEGLAPFARGFVPKLFAPATLAGAEPCVAEVAAMIRRSRPLGVCSALLAMLSRTDTTPALPGLQVPCLVLAGESDVLTPPAGARTLAAAIPKAEFAVIPGAGHLSSLENPSRFNRCLLDLLRRIPR